MREIRHLENWVQKRKLKVENMEVEIQAMDSISEK